MVSFCGSPTYQLSRYFTTILRPLTADKSRRKLQSTEDLIDAIKTVQIRKGLDKREMFARVTKHHQTLFGYQTIYRLDTLFGALWSC